MSANEGEQLDTALLIETVQALQEQLADHRRLLDSLADEMNAVPPGGPWAWSYLNAKETHDLFTELRGWVDWLVVRYRLGSTESWLPPCWYRHPVAVEELTALMVAWKSVYSQKARTPSSDLIAWHDRWLWPCIDRLRHRRIFQDCTSGRHQPSKAGRGTPVDDADFTDFLATGCCPDEEAPAVWSPVAGSTPTAPEGAETGDDAGAAWLAEAHQTQPVPVLPGDDEELPAERVGDYLQAGAAVSLLDDIGSPVRIAGQWWACADEDEPLWRLVRDEEQIAKLSAAWDRLAAIRDEEA